MGQRSVGQPTSETTSETATKGATVGRASVAIAALVALVIVVGIGWLVAGLPGLREANSVSVALLLIALVSGSLTLIFVMDALRKVRKREAAGTRDILVVVVCSLITGAVALIQLVQTVQQLPH